MQKLDFLLACTAVDCSMTSDATKDSVTLSQGTPMKIFPDTETDGVISAMNLRSYQSGWIRLCDVKILSPPMKPRELALSPMTASMQNQPASAPVVPTSQNIESQLIQTQQNSPNPRISQTWGKKTHRRLPSNDLPFLLHSHTHRKDSIQIPPGSADLLIRNYQNHNGHMDDRPNCDSPYVSTGDGRQKNSVRIDINCGDQQIAFKVPFFADRLGKPFVSCRVNMEKLMSKIRNKLPVTDQCTVSFKESDLSTRILKTDEDLRKAIAIGAGSQNCRLLLYVCQ